jgi:hypothetical protein
MGTEAMTSMATAVVPVQTTGSASVHALQNPTKVTEERAKVLRERHQSRITAARRVQSIKYPEDRICFAIVHEFQRLRREGYTAVGEIDDAVAETFRSRCGWLTGALVQDILGHFADMKVRELEAVKQLQLSSLEYMRNAGKETFQSAPGRGV